MSKRASIIAYSIACIASAGMWLGLALGTGNVEAWDHPLYFRAGLPLLAGVVLVLGYAVPERAWRWGLTSGVAQVISMFVLQPAAGPLIGVGLVLFALITGGLVLAALAGAGLSHWRHRWHAG